MRSSSLGRSKTNSVPPPSRSSEEGGQARWVAAGHAAFSSDAIDTRIATGGGEAGDVARCVVVMDEAEIQLALGRE